MHYMRVRRYGDPGPAQRLRFSASKDVQEGTCSNCGNVPVSRKGKMCSNCFRAYVKGLNKREVTIAEVFDGCKKCWVCKELKPVEEFHKRSKAKDGRNNTCHSCENSRSRIRGREPWTNLYKKYGITKERYEQMLQEQGGGCAICGVTEGVIDSRTGLPRRLHLDHNHKTGQLRGLLCSWHNVGIGHFKEDINMLIEATAYLMRYENVSEGVS